jgi:hypothetical protein
MHSMYTDVEITQSLGKKEHSDEADITHRRGRVASISDPLLRSVSLVKPLPTAIFLNSGRRSANQSTRAQ